MPNVKIPLVFKIAASALLLVFVLSKVDIQALLSTVSKSNLFLVLLGFLSSLVALLINTYKWQVLLAEPGAHLSYRELLRLNFIGLFYNLVFPGQVGGEVVKSVSLARMGVSGVTATVSVVADRVTGLLALFALGIMGALLTPSVTTVHPELLPWLAGLAVAFAIATVVLVTGRGQMAILAVGRALRVGQAPGISSALPTPATRGLAPERSEGSQLATPSIRSWSAMLAPLGLSLVVQATLVYTNLLLCYALNIPLTYVQLLWIVAVVSLLQSLPISIAGIGVREGAYVYLLQQQGVDSSSALALSLMVFAIQVVLAAVGGVLQLYTVVREKRKS